MGVVGTLVFLIAHRFRIWHQCNHCNTQYSRIYLILVLFVLLVYQLGLLYGSYLLSFYMVFDVRLHICRTLQEDWGGWGDLWQLDSQNTCWHFFILKNCSSLIHNFNFSEEYVVFDPPILGMPTYWQRASFDRVSLSMHKLHVQTNTMQHLSL